MDSLIKKLETVEKGSRLLDIEILREINPEYKNMDVESFAKGWLFGKGNHPIKVPSYTTSIDAAITLIPAALYNRAYFELCKPPMAGFRKSDMAILYYEAATPALAICVAALKARTAEVELGLRNY